MRDLVFISWLGVLLCLASPARAQAPVDALDAAWVAVCAGAQPGTAFFQRCQEILDAGPGSGGRRSDAALGNNLGQLPAQTGNASERRVAGSDEAVYRDSDGRLGWFLFAGFGNTERDATDFDAGFKGDLRRFGLGVDWRLSERTVLGAVLSQLDSDRRFDGGRGRADSRTRGLTGFLDWQSGGRVGAQAYLGFGDIDLDLRRQVRYSLVLNQGTPEQSTTTIDALASARPGGRQTMSGAGLQWDFGDGALGRGLRLGTDFSRTRIDAFSESGGAGLALSRDRSSRSSHTVNLGFDLSWTTSTASGVLVPYLRLDWINELKDDDRDVAVRFAGDSGGSAIRFQRERGERSYGEVAVGLSAVFAGGISGFIEAERMFSNSQLDHYMISLGLRVER
jgi:outer membrane autotransporter protein